VPPEVQAAKCSASSSRRNFGSATVRSDCFVLTGPNIKPFASGGNSAPVIDVAPLQPAQLACPQAEVSGRADRARGKQGPYGSGSADGDHRRPSGAERRRVAG
jgi:hypothetical protein